MFQTDTMPAKQCSRCGKTKSLSKFHKCAGGRFGRHTRCAKCRAETRDAAFLSSPEYRARVSRVSRIRTQRYREEVFRVLGERCVRCGFSDKRALQIDHINGGGVRDLKNKNQEQHYRHVIKDPDKYQILCANCNWIKRSENNEIPWKHKKQQKYAVA